MKKEPNESMTAQPLLQVEDLKIAFPRPNRTEKTVVNGIHFAIQKGEVLGVAGESGSGKSMTALAVMGLLPESAKWSAKKLQFADTSLQFSSRKEEEEVRSRLSGLEMSMIFQEPLTSLNPVQTIEKQMSEPLFLHRGMKKEARRPLVIEALKNAGLKNPAELLNQYPHQLSGGMRQRVMIAMALLNSPKLLIADEPTTALDAVTEREITELIRELAKKNGTTVLFISHNLNVLRRICDRVLIMKDGEIVEEGQTEDIFANPQKEYTKRLIQAVVQGPKEKAMAERGKATAESDGTAAASAIQDMCEAAGDTALSVEHLNVVFRKRKSVFHAPVYKEAVRDVSFCVKQGEIFGIVGESGCGKSTMLKVIGGLLKEFGGSLYVAPSEAGVQMVFQDPYTSLNPAKKVGWILEEPLRIHTKLTKQERRERVLASLRDTDLLPEIADRHIAELSGGQRQRVAIAAALMLHPKLVLLDEPVSALDVTVQAQILELLLRLQRDYGLTYVFVSHDMAVVRKICDRVFVMKNGQMVECGPAEQVFLQPKEAYTKRLIGAAEAAKQSESD